MSGRRPALIAGLVALLASALASRYPGLFGLGLGRVVLIAVGLVSLVLAWRAIRSWITTERADTIPPAPEQPLPVDPPGGTLADSLGHFMDVPLAYYTESQVREGLRSAAKTVLERYGEDSDGEAGDRLASGAWTDDPIAASFLGSSVAEPSSLVDRARETVGATPGFADRVARSVDAIAAIADVAFEQPATAETDRRAGAARDTSRPSAGASDSDGSAPVAEPGEPIETNHWRGVTVLTFLGIGIGVILQQPVLVLAGVTSVGFLAYANAGSPGTDGLAVERSVAPADPEPGDAVTVSVTVTNEGDSLQPDVRLVDGVPAALSVEDGAPRHATTLLPGQERTFTYELTARRGVHEFEDTLLLARTISGARETVEYRSVPTEITCVSSYQPTEEPVLLRGAGSDYVGELPTDSAGDGIEFYATREYRRGDEPGRIDWNRRARTGELTTIEFREDRNAVAMVVVDARPAAYVGPDAFEAHAVDRCVEAAGTVVTTLASAGHQVGLTALGAETFWLRPAAGKDHLLEAHSTLATHPALSPVPTTEQPRLGPLRQRIRERLSVGTQLFFVTPLADQFSVSTARKFESYGFPVTVISPDPTAETTAGARLGTVVRRLRLSELRDAGVAVVDWQWDEPLAAALARAAEVSRP